MALPTLTSLLARALDLLAPRLCPGCDAASGADAFCPSCRGELRYASPHPSVIAPYQHQGSIRRALHRFKYNDRPELAAPLARMLVVSARLPILAKGAVLVPVPLHPERLVTRGYNQAALLAGALGRQLGLRCLPDLLARERATASQVGQGALDRAHNVAGAFTCTSERLPSQLWLVDDVVTTGATARACAQAVQARGGRLCGVIALSRGGRVVACDSDNDARGELGSIT